MTQTDLLRQGVQDDGYTTRNHYSSFVYNCLPVEVARQDFNLTFHLIYTDLRKDPSPKLSLYKIFNYILYVLHTVLPWEQLKTNRKELHDTTLTNGTIGGQKMARIRASLQRLSCTCITRISFDTSVLHGDGSNTVVKGAKALATPAIRTLERRQRAHHRGKPRLCARTDCDQTRQPTRYDHFARNPHNPCGLRTRLIGIDLCGSSLTRPSVPIFFKDNKDVIKAHQMKPVIDPNRRNTKTPIAIARKFRWFDRALYRLVSLRGDVGASPSRRTRT